MRPAPLVLAAVLLLGWAGGAAGTPLIPILAGVALQSHSDIEAARWRHRHRRDYGWNDRRSGSARLDDTDAPGSNGNSLTTATDMVRPDLRRRRGWIDPPLAH